MNIQRVEKIFRRLSGLSPEETIGLRFLCEAAVEYIDCRLSNKEDGAGGDRLEFAAAAFAYYRYVLWKLTDGEMNKNNEKASLHRSGPVPCAGPGCSRSG